MLNCLYSNGTQRILTLKKIKGNVYLCRVWGDAPKREIEMKINDNLKLIARL